MKVESTAKTASVRALPGRLQGFAQVWSEALAPLYRISRCADGRPLQRLCHVGYTYRCGRGRHFGTEELEITMRGR